MKTPAITSAPMMPTKATRDQRFHADSLSAPSGGPGSERCLIGPAARRRAGLILLATLVGVAATARLGIWQLDRAAQKVAIQARIEARRTLPILSNAELARTAPLAAEQVERRASLRGRWLTDRTVFLDNRQMAGKPGFYVVTPLQLDGRPEAVAVQRGWVPRNFADRRRCRRCRTPRVGQRDRRHRPAAGAALRVRCPPRADRSGKISTSAPTRAS
jgi:surfeit locus 1 family protein